MLVGLGLPPKQPSFREEMKLNDGEACSPIAAGSATVGGTNGRSLTHASQPSVSSSSSAGGSQTWAAFAGRTDGYEGYQRGDVVRGLARHVRAAGGDAVDKTRQLAALGRDLLSEAFVHREIPFPGKLQEGVFEAMEIPLPDSETSWAECYRDLDRAVRGNSVFIMGKDRLFPHSAPSNGDEQTPVNAGALEALEVAIRDEIQAQGLGGRCNGHDVDAPTRQDADGIRELTLRVAAQISVSPGVEATIQSLLQPALWQPMFLVCIGAEQVRVVTCAFIGEPVTGDRPDRKRTPFMMRLATCDLAKHAREAKNTSVAVHFLAERAGCAESSMDYVVKCEDKLFAAIGTGDWSGFSKADAKPMVIRRRLSEVDIACVSARAQRLRSITRKSCCADDAAQLFVQSPSSTDSAVPSNPKAPAIVSTRRRSGVGVANTATRGIQPTGIVRLSSNADIDFASTCSLPRGGPVDAVGTRVRFDSTLSVGDAGRASTCTAAQGCTATPVFDAVNYFSQHRLLNRSLPPRPTPIYSMSPTNYGGVPVTTSSSSVYQCRGQHLPQVWPGTPDASRVVVGTPTAVALAPRTARGTHLNASGYVYGSDGL